MAYVLVTPTQIRTDFPEFANTTSYPDSLFMFWIVVAYHRFNAYRWGDLYNLGIELFVCHNVTIERDNGRAAQRTATPGAQKGPISSETTGSVSASYDAAIAAEPGYGNYNLTNYGTRYAELLSLVGAGPITVIC